MTSSINYPDTPGELERFWQAHMVHWRSSGQTQVDYCRERGLSVHRLRWWKTKFERHRKSIETGGQGFIPVQVQTLPGGPAGQVDSGVRVWVSERVCVEVAVGFDQATLGAVVQVLGG